jgi:hypothetical protein
MADLLQPKVLDSTSHQAKSLMTEDEENELAELMEDD